MLEKTMLQEPVVRTLTAYTYTSTTTTLRTLL